MAWKLKDDCKPGIGKAWQLSKALVAMGFTSWNRLEPGDYSCTPFSTRCHRGMVISQYVKYMTATIRTLKVQILKIDVIFNIY